MIALVAPFIIGIALLVLGGAAARIATHGMELRLEANFAQGPGKVRRALPQEFYPKKLRDYADWVADSVSAASTLVAPLASLLLSAPLSRASEGVPLAAAANAVAVAVSIALMAAVVTVRDVGDWREKYKWGWLSPIVLWGVLANAACMVLALVAQRLVPSAA